MNEQPESSESTPKAAEPVEEVEPVDGDDRQKYLPEPLVQAPGDSEPQPGERPAEQPKPPRPKQT